jgi:hypothetical protein
MAGTISEILADGVGLTHCKDRAPLTQAVRIPTGTLLVLNNTNQEAVLSGERKFVF